MGVHYQFTDTKMKLIVLIALVGCALAIPNPCLEDIVIPDLPSPAEKYGPANGLKIPDYHPYTPKEKYGPTNGLRIPDHYYQKGYSKGYYHPVRCVPVRRRYRCLPRRRSRCIRRRRTCYEEDITSEAAESITSTV